MKQALMCRSQGLPGERRTISALVFQQKNIDMGRCKIYLEQIYDRR